MSEDHNHDELTEAPDLAELTYEELGALEEALVSEFEDLSSQQDFTADTMQELRDVVEAVELVREEAAQRVEFALMQEELGAVSVAEFADALATEEFAEAPAEDEAPEDEEEEAPEDEEDSTEELGVMNPKMKANRFKKKGGMMSYADEATEEFAEDDVDTDDISPEGLQSATVPATPARKLAITASADVPGYAAGQELDGIMEVAEALMQKRLSVRGTDKGNDGYQYLVASIQTREYDEAHRLGNDAIVNLGRVEQVTAPGSLTAAGGIKAPLTPYYELSVFGDSVRPVRDALPAFQAERGGIRFVPSPVIGDTSAGVNVYAESVDASATPYGAGKGVVTITVGSETTVKVDVVPRIMKVGNLMARTFPEMVAAWTRLLIAQHAREAESNLLNYLTAGSTSISGTSTYGAASTLLGQIDQIVAGYRSRHRIASNVRFRCILPFWVKDILRTDVTRRQFGADWALSDAAIEAWFAARNIVPTFHYDESSSTTSVYSSQAAGAYTKYPTTVEWFLFPEGTWLFLDGGTLDLGLVRDSTLNSTNDYTIFAETFEAAARVGQQSLRVTSTVVADGSTSGPNTIAY
jgi:hypothetical protein